MKKIIKHLLKIHKKKVIIGCPCTHRCSECDELIMAHTPYQLAFKSTLERLSGHHGKITCGACVSDLKS